MADWHLVIHGGCGSMRPGKLTHSEEKAALAGLEQALDSGGAILAAGGRSLDAVEAAVRVLEDDPAFNAGCGSVLNAEGIVELDAAIMDGHDRSAGAVAGLRTVRSPIGLARRVMEHGQHVLLSFSGAEQFAREQGVEIVDNGWFQTPERRAQLERILARGGFDSDVKFGTVGAVAVDMNGHVAAATSTGGLTAKRWGRIGDSPLIGCGTYADDRAAAVSTTGSGEYFIRTAAAHELCAQLRIGRHGLQAAIQMVLADIKSLGGSGGLIAVTPDGKAEWGFTTPGMYRARVSAVSREVAVFGP